jgi:hypothetical protein
MKRKTIFTAFVLTLLAFSVHAASDVKVHTGLFKAKNSTDHTVTIRVGNFIPTSYTLAPHSSEMITVSSDNQNIEISNVS